MTRVDLFFTLDVHATQRGNLFGFSELLFCVGECCSALLRCLSHPIFKRPLQIADTLPEVIESPEAIAFVENGNLVLVCEALGKPLESHQLKTGISLRCQVSLKAQIEPEVGIALVRVVEGAAGVDGDACDFHGWMNLRGWC